MICCLNWQILIVILAFDRKLGDGLFLECCREVSKDYPNIEFNDLIIDNASMQVSVASCIKCCILNIKCLLDSVFLTSTRVTFQNL